MREIAFWMGGCICFPVRDATEIGMWELGENSLTWRNIKVHGDSVRIFIMCRPQGFGKK